MHNDDYTSYKMRSQPTCPQPEQGERTFVAFAFSYWFRLSRPFLTYWGNSSPVPSPCGYTPAGFLSKSSNNFIDKAIISISLLLSVRLNILILRTECTSDCLSTVTKEDKKLKNALIRNMDLILTSVLRPTSEIVGYQVRNNFKLSFQTNRQNFTSITETCLAFKNLTQNLMNPDVLYLHIFKDYVGFWSRLNFFFRNKAMWSLFLYVVRNLLCV